MDDNIKTIFIGVGILLLLFLVSVFSPIVIVPSGNVGILTEFGAVKQVMPEGLHFRIPIMQNVEIMEVRTQKFEVLKANAASSDLQVVTTSVALNYHIDKAKANEVYQKIGVNWGDKVITPAILESLKATTAKYTAEELITKRELVKKELEDSLRERLGVYNLIMETISITNFDFSPDFNAAIEKKVTSQQSKLNEEQILGIKQIQAQQALAEAQGQANSKTTLAAAEANATLVKAQAEAQAVKLITEQLAEQPEYVEYIKAQRWDGKLPLVSGGNTINMLNLSG